MPVKIHLLFIIIDQQKWATKNCLNQILKLICQKWNLQKKNQCLFVERSTADLSSLTSVDFNQKTTVN